MLCLASNDTCSSARMNEMLIDDCVGVLGLTRSRVTLWHKQVRGLPDRQVLGGFWLRFVDVEPVEAQ